MLSAFGHYPLLSFQLAKVLKTPIAGKVGPYPKSGVQQLLLCPKLSRIFMAYGAPNDGGAAGAQPHYRRQPVIPCLIQCPTAVRRSMQTFQTIRDVKIALIARHWAACNAAATRVRLAAVMQRAGTYGLLTCSLQAVSSRIRALHSLLLIAATLRNLLAECAACMARLTKELDLARKTFVKVFGLYALDGQRAAGPAHWEAIKGQLRCELQVRSAAALRLCRKIGTTLAALPRTSFRDG